MKESYKASLFVFSAVLVGLLLGCIGGSIMNYIAHPYGYDDYWKIKDTERQIDTVRSGLEYWTHNHTAFPNNILDVNGRYYTFGNVVLQDPEIEPNNYHLVYGKKFYLSNFYTDNIPKGSKNDAYQEGDLWFTYPGLTPATADYRVIVIGRLKNGDFVLGRYNTLPITVKSLAINDYMRLENKFRYELGLPSIQIHTDQPFNPEGD